MKIMKRQHGFSLLEALIALVIVSVGLLGVAGIIANSLRVNQGAQIRSQASWLAHGIIDSMRANRATAGDYALADCGDAPGAGTIAGDDIDQWCAALAAALPAGTGSIDVSASVVMVVVQWDDTRATHGVADQKFVMETRL